MKIVSIFDPHITPDVLHAGVTLIKAHARAYVEFDTEWNVIEKVCNLDHFTLNVIAVIGPTAKGQAVLFEVGRKRHKPYLRTSLHPGRIKLTDIIPAWEHIFPVLSELINAVCSYDIRQWTRHQGSWGYGQYFWSFGRQRRVRGGVRMVNRLWEAGKEGVVIHVAAADRMLWQCFLEAEVLLSHRFKRRLHGLLGTIHVFMRHHGREAEKLALHLLTEDEMFNYILSQKLLPFLLAYSESYRAGLKAYVERPYDLLYVLRNNALISQVEYQALFNYVTMLESWRTVWNQCRRQRSDWWAAMFSELQVEYQGSQFRQTADQKFYQFKVYEVPQSELARSTDEELPF